MDCSLVGPTRVKTTSPEKSYMKNIKNASITALRKRYNDILNYFIISVSMIWAAVDEVREF
jgi:hypothetical protein